MSHWSTQWSAAGPALAHFSSCSGSPPLTPIAPTALAVDHGRQAASDSSGIAERDHHQVIRCKWCALAFHHGSIFAWPKPERPCYGFMCRAYRRRHTQEISAMTAVRLRRVVLHLDQGYRFVPPRVQPVKTPEAIGLDGPERCLLHKALVAKALQHRATGIEVCTISSMLRLCGFVTTLCGTHTPRIAQMDHPSG